MTQSTSQTADGTKLSDDAICGRHSSFVRERRTKVNVENVLHFDADGGMTYDRRPLASETLKKLIDRSGLHGDKLSQALGFKTRSGIQNYTDDLVRRDFPLKFVRRCAQALVGLGDPKITPSDVMLLLGDYPPAQSAVQEATYLHTLELSTPKEIADFAQVSISRSTRLPLVGTAHASYWMPRAPSFEDPESWLLIPFGSGMDAETGQYVLAITGPSMNQVAKEGEFAICETFGGKTGDLEHGDIVHAERVRSNGEVEWTLKKVEWRGGYQYLCPDSDHPDFQEPLIISDREGDRVRVLGIVVSIHRNVRKSK